MLVVRHIKLYIKDGIQVSTIIEVIIVMLKIDTVMIVTLIIIVILKLKVYQIRWVRIRNKDNIKAK